MHASETTAGGKMGEGGGEGEEAEERPGPENIVRFYTDRRDTAVSSQHPPQAHTQIIATTRPTGQVTP